MHVSHICGLFGCRKVLQVGLSSSITKCSKQEVGLEKKLSPRNGFCAQKSSGLSDSGFRVSGVSGLLSVDLAGLFKILLARRGLEVSKSL